MGLLMISIYYCGILFYALIIWLIIFITQSRIHFIEFHEQSWCPVLFREIIINSIQVFWCMFDLTNIFGSPAQTVASIIDNLNINKHKLTILDLCSGSGGPITVINSQLNNNKSNTCIQTSETTTILTDLFPHLTKWSIISSNNSNIKYCKTSVDATKVDLNNIKQNLNIKMQMQMQKPNESEHILRSIFGAFHHFPPDLAISILSDAMERNHAFIAAELVHRYGIIHFLIIMSGMITTVPLLLIMQIKYYCIDQYFESNSLQKLWNILLTIITTPIWSAMFANDTIISCARSYKEDELINLTKLATIKANKNKRYAYDIEYEWKCWTQNSNMMFPLNFVLPITILYGSIAKKDT